jgi:hypothetical protein
MLLHRLSKYRSGYTGLIERSNTYEWFKMTRSGRFNRLRVYQKEDFEEWAHFKSVVAKFVSTRGFFDPPIALESCSIRELDEITTEIAHTNSRS